MSRKKREVTVEKKLTPYEMGLTGTVKDFYAADQAAREDIVAKQAAYKKSDKKSDWLPWAMEQYKADRKALSAAKEAPYQIRELFHQGACDAFDERPDNIQFILAIPGEFVRHNWRADINLVSDTLITLLDKSANPDTVLDIALEKVANDKKQDIFDNTLHRFVYREAINEKPVSALLKAGAEASSEILAIALHNDAPAEVTDMLIVKGAKIDEALQTMRDDPGTYGTLPYELEILQQAVRIQDLERKLAESKEQITGAPVKQRAVASPVPAATGVPRPRLLLR